MSNPLQAVIKESTKECGCIRFYFEIGHMTHDGQWKIDEISGPLFYTAEQAQHNADREIRILKTAYERRQERLTRSMLNILAGNGASA